MSQNPELHLWRMVLAEALRAPDGASWIETEDGITVVSLAGLDHEYVKRKVSEGVLRSGRKVKHAA